MNMLRNCNVEYPTGKRLLTTNLVGVPTGTVPSSGTHGAGFAYDSLVFPQDADSLVLGYVTRFPTTGTLSVLENTAFSFEPSVSGVESFDYIVKVNDVEVAEGTNYLVSGPSQMHLVLQTGELTAGGFVSSPSYSINPSIDVYTAPAGTPLVRWGMESPLPSWLPLPGQIATVGLNTLNSIAADVDEQFSLPKVLSAWGTAAVSLQKSGGQVTDVIYWIFGGGHGDTANDGVYAWRSSTRLFEKVVPPSASAVALMALNTTDNTTDTVHGEDIFGRPDSQHTYQHLYGLDSDEAFGPSLMQVYGSAIGQGAISSGQAHRLPYSSKVWERWSNLAPTGVALTSAIIKDTLRQKFVRFPSDNGSNFYTLDYTDEFATWQTFTQSSRIGNWSDTHEACGVYDPVRDLYIAGTQRGPGSNFCAISAASPTGSWTQLTFVGGPTNVWGSGLMYRPVDDTFLLVDTSTNPPNGIWVLTPPATNPLTNPWTWTRRSFTGTSRYASMLVSGTESFNRFQYVEAFDSILVSGAAGFGMEAWKL